MVVVGGGDCMHRLNEHERIAVCAHVIEAGTSSIDVVPSRNLLTQLLLCYGTLVGTC